MWVAPNSPIHLAVVLVDVYLPQLAANMEFPSSHHQHGLPPGEIAARRWLASRT